MRIFKKDLGMWKNELKTPFGAVHIFQNGQPVHFLAVPFDYGIYLADGTRKVPQGLYRLYPDKDSLRKGDILLCKFDSGQLRNDGGGEYMVNIVGTYNGHTIGMGAPDSEDIERHYTQRERVLPYKTWGETARGFEIHIIDTPKERPCEKSFEELCFIVAWEPGTTDEAWNLISFVTT